MTAYHRCLISAADIKHGFLFQSSASVLEQPLHQAKLEYIISEPRSTAIPQTEQAADLRANLHTRIIRAAQQVEGLFAPCLRPKLQLPMLVSPQLPRVLPPTLTQRKEISYAAAAKQCSILPTSTMWCNAPNATIYVAVNVR